MRNIDLLARRFGPESGLSREKLLVRLVDDPRDVATSYGSGARYYPFAQEDIFHPKAYGGGARIWGFWKDGNYVDLAAIRDRDTRNMTYGDLAADIRFLLQIRSPWGDDSDASEEPFHEDYLLKALPPCLTYEKFLVVMDTILKAELVDRKLRIWKVPKDTSLSA